jgi:hypothetical protein
MKRYLLILIGVPVLVAVAIVVLVQSEHTNCYAAFDDRETADQLAIAARFAGFNSVDVEERGPASNEPSSAGARRIAVTFTTGETGGDAEELTRVFQGFVRGTGGFFGHPGGGCLERGYFD